MSRNSLAVSGGGGRSLTGAGAHDVPAGIDPPVHRAAPGPVPQAGPAGRSPGRRGHRRRPAGPALGLGPGRSGAAGGRLLAHQPDHAPARAAVRHLALGRAPRPGHPRSAAGVGPGAAPASGAGRHRRRHLDPTRDHRLAARSTNYRYATNLQIAIDATTRLVIAIGDPQPGNRNDTVVYRSSGMKDQLAGREVMADGGYRGHPEVIMPYRKPRDGSELPAWKQAYNANHRRIRARAEHALARLKTYKILRDYRRAGSTLATAASGIAHLHNIALAG